MLELHGVQELVLVTFKAQIAENSNRVVDSRSADNATADRRPVDGIAGGSVDAS